MKRENWASLMDVGCSRQALSGTSTTEDLLASFSRSRLGKHGCLIAQTFESLYMYTVWSYGQFCFERIGIAGDECHRLVIGRPGVKLLDRSRFSEYRYCLHVKWPMCEWLHILHCIPKWCTVGLSDIFVVWEYLDRFILRQLWHHCNEGLIDPASGRSIKARRGLKVKAPIVGDNGAVLFISIALWR